MSLMLFALPASAYAFTLPSFPSLPSFFRGSSTNAEMPLPEGVVLAGACLKLSALDARVGERVRAATARYEDKAQLRLARMSAGLQVRGSLQARAQTDARLAAYFKTLDSKAGTDAAKKHAVADFKERVVKASDARRSAIDAAAKAYLSGSSAVARGRIEQVKKLAEDMRLELSAAVSSGDGRCRIGADQAAVRADLQKTLSAIERTYAAKLLDRGSLAAGLLALSDTYTGAIEKANASFSAELDSASQALNSVLQ